MILSDKGQSLSPHPDCTLHSLHTFRLFYIYSVVAQVYCVKTVPVHKCDCRDHAVMRHLKQQQ